jgi:hypothetical protein
LLVTALLVLSAALPTYFNRPPVLLKDVDASLPGLEHAGSQSGAWQELRAKVKQGNHLQVQEGRSHWQGSDWDFPKRERQKVNYSGNCPGMLGLAARFHFGTTPKWEHSAMPKVTPIPAGNGSHTMRR